MPLHNESQAINVEPLKSYSLLLKSGESKPVESSEPQSILKQETPAVKKNDSILKLDSTKGRKSEVVPKDAMISV